MACAWGIYDAFGLRAGQKNSGTHRTESPEHSAAWPATERGLVSLEQLIGKRKPLRKWVIYRGERKQRFENGTEVWPVIEALAALV